MKIRANEMKAGQVIRFEYGDYDNFIKGEVTSVKENKQFVDVEVSVTGQSYCVCFNKDEFVEVFPDENE